MIRLDVTPHDTMCAGMTYSGTASFDGKTVKDVLREIKEFARDKRAAYLGEGFGNPNSIGFGDAWRIAIDDIIYWNGWGEQKWDKVGIYDPSLLDNLTVESISVDGGWYCFYDFNIHTKEGIPPAPKDEEDEEKLARFLLGY